MLDALYCRAYEALESDSPVEGLPDFSTWLQKRADEHFQECPDDDEDLYYISRPPTWIALNYKAMWAYGNHFRVVSDISEARVTYDARLCAWFPCPAVEGSSKTVDVEYVGELTHILHLSYSTRVPVVLLKGRWVRPPQQGRHPSMVQDEDGFTLANFKQLAPIDKDPYVWPEAVRQAYFLHHHGRNSGWRVVVRTDPRSRRVY